MNATHDGREALSNRGRGSIRVPRYGVVHAFCSEFVLFAYKAL